MKSVFYTLWFFLISSSYSIAQESVFPSPKEYKKSSGNLQLEEILNVFGTDTNLRIALESLHERFENLNSIHVQFTNNKSKAVVFCVKNEDLSAESYQIQITDKIIQISYADYNGLYYSLLSISQLINEKKQINCAEISDMPRFSYRGTHLDCSRHFYTIPEIKNFIDELAALKINHFHWHLTDDQGWRIEIKKYPKLTTVGGFRDSTLIGHARNNPAQYDTTRYGGFYTQEEAKDLVEYCKNRGMTIVPEIELPGHARAALAAYPEMGCSGEFQPVASTWGVFQEVFCSKEQTLTFLKDILTEIMTVFPSETIHIGGDEVPKESWKKCAKCQLQKEKHTLKDEFELQAFIIHEMEMHLRANGRKLIGWDEILEGGLAENAQVMSWQGISGGIAAAKSGHYVVMTPGSHCYFDHYQSAHTNEQLSWGGFTPLSKVYSFEPVPEELTLKEKSFILGAQANLWTEYLPTIQNVEINAFPRIVALAEVLWCEKKKPYTEFVNSLVENYLPRLDKMGISYSKAVFDPDYSCVPTSKGIEIHLKSVLNNVQFKEDSVQLITISKKKLVQHFEISPSYKNDSIRKTHIELTSHLALGKPINYLTEPKEPYTFQKDFGLTNGIVGTKPWNGKQWIGFREDTIQFTIDLEKKTKFSSIEFSCLSENNSWIYLPKNYAVLSSTDGVTYKVVNVSKWCGEKNRLSTNFRARYVRLVFYQNSLIPAGSPGEGFIPWTFIDEIIITK